MGRLIRSSEFDGENNLIQRIEQLYDKANRLEKQSWVIEGTAYSESYTYRTTDGMLSSAQTATGDTIVYAYDSLKRLGGTAVENAAGDPLFRTGYSYKAGTASNQTTNQVLVYTTWNPNYTNLCSYRYRYDAVGNIIKIEDVTNTARTLAEYTYDELNQLTQEKIYNYNSNGTYTSTDTYVYTYDSAGNILTEKKNNTVVNAYTYSTGTWADQLVAVNGEEITYDGSGNPNIYVSGYGESYYMVGFDGRNWLGFQTLSGTQLQVAYDYDADGIRTAKCVDGEDHDYVTQNGKVVREIIEAGTTEKVLDFVYDNSGKPFALTYTNGTATPVTYYYVLNIQGDVVALMTADRTIVARYAYNAWGKVLSVTNDIGTAITSASHIANLNPIRYRGYYYDTETGFYYLQSRYYDPANHRFINADCYTSTGQGFLGYNMFAYCNNNPVVYYDERGTSLVSTEFMLKDDVYSGGQVTVLVISINGDVWIKSSQIMGEDFANAIGANNVIVYPVAEKTFAETWNSTNASYVIIHMHGTPTGIFDENFSFTTIEHEVLKTNIRIKGVFIDACSTGGKPGFGKNIAQVFTRKISPAGKVVCCTGVVAGTSKIFYPVNEDGKWVVYQSGQATVLDEHTLTMERAAVLMR